MAGWSQSHFLQALGWATLNSFWQMAVLWCIFLGIKHTFKLSADQKFRAAVAGLLIGFSWGIASFILYYQQSSSTYSFLSNSITHSNTILQLLLFSASFTYLLLLAFPAFRLFRNWRFVQIIKKQGITKASLSHRLFVKKVSGHLGLKKKVIVLISDLVSSPLTVGYLKPMILLPVAALNQLSTTQVEAILLHELSHIRRYDYLINLIVSFIHTVLYFNLFARFFIDTIEAERETCCDEVVLQFGYDKLNYASALLHLEKAAGINPILTMAAAGKQNLLTRIEKIVGMEKKKTFKLIQIVPLLAALICVLLFNSVLIINDAKSGNTISYTSDGAFMPWQLNESKRYNSATPFPAKIIAQQPNKATASSGTMKIDIFNSPAVSDAVQTQGPTLLQNLLPVDYNEVDGRLTKEEKENVKNTMNATKKVATELQWNTIETSIADVLDNNEKAQAKKEYLSEIEKVNWNNIEQNIKANYDKLDWETIHANVALGMAKVQLDSLQTVYTTAMDELLKIEKEVKVKSKIKLSPIPDCSVQQINLARITLQQNIDSIKKLRPKKIVRL